MLIFILVTSIMILSFIIFYCDYKFWDTGILDYIFGSLGLFSFLIFFIITTILILNLCSAPFVQAAYEERYFNLIKKSEHIDSYNYDEVIKQINDWNQEYRENTYARKSPWINWFVTIDTSTTSLIELKEI